MKRKVENEEIYKIHFSHTFSALYRETMLRELKIHSVSALRSLRLIQGVLHGKKFGTGWFFPFEQVSVLFRVRLRQVLLYSFIFPSYLFKESPNVTSSRGRGGCTRESWYYLEGHKTWNMSTIRGTDPIFLIGGLSLWGLYINWTSMYWELRL